MEGAGLRAWDGILGLTFDNRETGRPRTLLSALHAEGMLSARQLTFLLLDQGDSDPFEADAGVGAADDDEQSTLEVGGMTMVPNKTRDQMTWVLSAALSLHQPPLFVCVLRLSVGFVGLWDFSAGGLR